MKAFTHESFINHTKYPNLMKALKCPT